MNWNRIKAEFLTLGRRQQTRALLLLAVAVGTLLRFFRLGTHELSIDESLSWAESSGHNVKAVIRVQHKLDSGKLPIYELVQHGWMRIFGQSEAAMRALPALIGSLSIVLVFIVGMEVLRAAGARDESGTEQERAWFQYPIYMVAAWCALLFAVALPSVEVAREARMYSMMQAWILAQVTFLFRARRVGGWVNYAGLTIFTAIAVATNFTAVLVMAAEGTWLIYLYFVHRRDHAPLDADGRAATPWLTGAALVAAIVLLLPFFAGLRYGVEGVARGDYAWIKPPGRWEPFATFETALGSFPFPLFAAFAIAGAIRLWRMQRDQAVLLILWIALPPIVLFAGSYLVAPMLVTRYLISSFVPLFILAAIGVDAIPSRHYRSVAIVALVGLSIVRASAELRHGDNRWRDACQLALRKAGSADRVGIANEYYMVNYYMPQAERSSVKLVRVPYAGIERKAPLVVILSPTVAHRKRMAIRREYSVVVGRFKNLTVVARPRAGVPNDPLG